jgi:hypothetical protein
MKYAVNRKSVLNKKFTKAFLSFVTFLLMFMMIALLWAWGTKPKKFVEQSIPLKTYDLFDVGIADVNQDNFLDIFTTNHSARQSLLINNGKGQFIDQISEKQLDQDRVFASLEDTDSPPSMEKSGLYIYRQERLLHLVAHNLDEPHSISGKIDVPWPMEVLSNSHAKVNVTKKKTLSGVMQSTVYFSLDNDGSIALNGNEDIIEIPHNIELDQKIPLNLIFVGGNRISPKFHKFQLLWRDRHSMAWADLNNDEKLDLFISRGGIKGKMGLLPQNFAKELSDELLVSQNELFTDLSSKSGFDKQSCPGRQAAWLDFNNDDKLDLYVVCGRPEEPKFPNQFYLQEKDNEFRDAAENYAINLLEDNPFIWFHANSDSYIDLLTAKDNRIVLFENNEAKTLNATYITKKIKGVLRKFSLGDYDQDGDSDVFVVTSEKCFLLVNNNYGSFSQVEPSEIGLPQKALTANWVDYDNDNLMDLHVIPGGIYRQLPNQRFLQTHILESKSFFNRVLDARCSWFDVDNDGDRDLVAAMQYYSPIDNIFKFGKVDPSKANPATGWQTTLYQNQLSGHHWLEITLVGSERNRQAIGADLRLKTSAGFIEQQVGSAEGSHYSQGHYRLYFGLGKLDRIDEVTVTWNDGAVQKIKGLHIDQLIKVQRDNAPFTANST